MQKDFVTTLLIVVEISLLMRMINFLLMISPYFV